MMMMDDDVLTSLFENFSKDWDSRIHRIRNDQIASIGSNLYIHVMRAKHSHATQAGHLMGYVGIEIIMTFLLPLH